MVDKEDLVGKLFRSFETKSAHLIIGLTNKAEYDLKTYNLTHDVLGTAIRSSHIGIENRQIFSPEELTVEEAKRYRAYLQKKQAATS
ncbi:hypothetical protein JXA48_05295 [Candidatus Woesearchaeota archaeon]|nr:hypothetical protein [Candidatus Woesearchaeota archaeon]